MDNTTSSETMDIENSSNVDNSLSDELIFISEDISKKSVITEGSKSSLSMTTTISSTSEIDTPPAKKRKNTVTSFITSFTSNNSVSLQPSVMSTTSNNDLSANSNDTLSTTSSTISSSVQELEKTLRKELEDLRSILPWISGEEDRVREYLSSRQVYCLCCEKPYSNRLDNLKTHEKKDKHIRNKWKLSHAKKNVADSIKSAAKTDEEAKIYAAKKNLLLESCRKFMKCFLIGRGINPNLIHNSIGDERFARMFNTVYCHGMTNICGSGTHETDVAFGHELLWNYMKTKVVNTVGSIVTDGASFRHDKVIAIMYSSHALEKPILLNLLYPTGESEEQMVYNATAAANDIRSSLQEFDIPLTNITCLSGDNAAINGAIAKQLGIPRAKCIAHALNLVVKHGITCIPNVKTLTVTAGSLIYAGGTDTRKHSLELVNLRADKLQVYTNRFADIINVVNYVYENFDKVKLWYTTSTTFSSNKDKSNINTNDEDEDEEDNESELSKYELCKRAYEDPYAKIYLYIAIAIYEHIIKLIKQSEHEFDHTPTDFLDQLEQCQSSFKDLSTTALSTVMDGITTIYGNNHNVPETTINSLVAAITSAATNSLQTWEKHMVPAIEHLQLRFRYYPKLRPEPLPNGSALTMKFFVSDSTRVWPDKPPSTFNRLVTSYKQYINEYESVLQTKGQLEIEKRKSYEYWKSKESVWPELSKAALWSIEIPTSSIACERAFATLRTIGIPQRSSQLQTTVRREMLFRINKHLMDELMNKFLDDLEDLDD